MKNKIIFYASIVNLFRSVKTYMCIFVYFHISKSSKGIFWHKFLGMKLKTKHFPFPQHLWHAPNFFSTKYSKALAFTSRQSAIKCRLGMFAMQTMQTNMPNGRTRSGQIKKVPESMQICGEMIEIFTEVIQVHTETSIELV